VLPFLNSSPRKRLRSKRILQWAGVLVLAPCHPLLLTLPSNKRTLRWEPPFPHLLLRRHPRHPQLDQHLITTISHLLRPAHSTCLSSIRLRHSVGSRLITQLSSPVHHMRVAGPSNVWSTTSSRVRARARASSLRRKRPQSRPII
jgi:hypothetical protein